MTSPVSEVLVDLGDMFDVPPRVLSRPGSVVPSSVRFIGPVLAVMLLLSAAAPPGPPLLTEVISVPVGGSASVLIDGDRMFVYAGGLRNTITSYGLDDRRQRWSTMGAEQATQSSMLVVDGTVVVTTDVMTTKHPNTESFDAETGRRLWSSEFGAALATDHGILTQVIASPAKKWLGLAGPSGYVLLDPRTGATTWSIAVPDDCFTGVDILNPTTLAEVCWLQSAVHLIDLSDGRTVRSRQIPLARQADHTVKPPDQVLLQPQVAVVGTAVLVAHSNAPTPTIDAYALSDLRLLWGGLPERQGQDITGVSADANNGRSPDPISQFVSVRQPGPATLTVTGPDMTQAAAVRTVAAGSGFSIRSDPSSGVWLQRSSGRLIAHLDGIGPSSCVESAGYLACVTNDGHLTVWKSP